MPPVYFSVNRLKVNECHYLHPTDFRCNALYILTHSPKQWSWPALSNCNEDTFYSPAQNTGDLLFSGHNLNAQSDDIKKGKERSKSRQENITKKPFLLSPF